MPSPKRHLQLAPAVSEVSDTAAPRDEELLRVGELAKATGKTVRAIHLYEELGLIEPVRRSKGHYRLFSPDALVRVRWVTKMQELGLSLTDVQALVTSRAQSGSAPHAATELRATYEERLAEVERKIAALQELKAELQASLGYLDACQTSCEDDVQPNLCSSCGRHHDGEPAIDLIAGAHQR